MASVARSVRRRTVQQFVKHTPLWRLVALQARQMIAMPDEEFESAVAILKAGPSAAVGRDLVVDTLLCPIIDVCLLSKLGDWAGIDVAEWLKILDARRGPGFIDEVRIRYTRSTWPALLQHWRMPAKCRWRHGVWRRRFTGWGRRRSSSGRRFGSTSSRRQGSARRSFSGSISARSTQSRLSASGSPNSQSDEPAARWSAHPASRRRGCVLSAARAERGAL